MISRCLCNVQPFGQFTRLASTFTSLTSQEFMKNPTNEPILEYRKGTVERIALEQALSDLSKNPVDIPIVIGTQKLTNDLDRTQRMPFDHEQRVARYRYATSLEIQNAIEVAIEARQKWDRRLLAERVDIFLHAADLCASKYRMRLNAATMLGQGKTIFQAEIDSACELVDFLRFNAYFALQCHKNQPISTSISNNSLVYRGLEGFVAAIAPFNFTAIGGNLASAPALMGNVVLWKPSDTAILGNYIAYQAFEEAGLPPGVISFLPSEGPVFGNTVCDSQHLAGVNFTGSVPTFRYIWKRVSDNFDQYINLPRLSGELGGKNFHFIHPSANIESVIPCTFRAAFEYQGQKCSACSRLFVPASLWPKIEVGLKELASAATVGDVRDGSVFMSAVIDKNAYTRIKSFINLAKSGIEGTQLVFGGKCDEAKGYFIEPTCIRVKNFKSRLLTNEIFGPVLNVYVYDDQECETVLNSIKDATPYGLTGAIFAQDNGFIKHATDVLRDAVGNFYINDKCTGAVVGQQPFGGARRSGTNDKAGGPHYILRWTSTQTIKETTVPRTEWRYPHMD